MTRCGDLVIVDFPFTSGTRSKVRPALVVQNDADNRRLSNTIIAMVSGNITRAAEPTHLFIDPATPEGSSSGLHGRSVVVCVNLYTIEQTNILRTIGHLSSPHKQMIQACLKAALDLP
jgi:mRNA interferase MazF